MLHYNLYISTIICILFVKSYSISFHLMKHRQICINIPTPNVYQFEYSISNQNQLNVQCIIYNTNTEVINTIQYKSTYKTIINITSSEGKICFRLLDTISKIVSFDLIGLNDPMRGQIIQKDVRELYEKMDTLYRSMERLYRNNHFYYERNRGHKQILNDLELKLKQIKVLKIVSLLICGIIQYFLIKKILDRKDSGQNRKNRQKIEYSPIRSV